MSWRRLIPLSLALLLAPAAAPVAEAQFDDTPGSWVQYAVRVGNELQARFANDQDAAAVAVHVFFDAHAANSGITPPAPILNLWFDSAGSVSRLEFTSVGDPQIDKDVRQVVTHRAFGAPPQDMRQPLVLRLHLIQTL